MGEEVGQGSEGTLLCLGSALAADEFELVRAGGPVGAEVPLLEEGDRGLQSLPALEGRGWAMGEGLMMERG